MACFIVNQYPFSFVYLFTEKKCRRTGFQNEIDPHPWIQLNAMRIELSKECDINLYI